MTPPLVALDPAGQERVFALWDELSAFQPGESEAADDPLGGWRVGAMTSLRVPAPADGDLFREILKQWDRRQVDPSFLLPLREVGRFRVYSFRRELPPEWFASPFYRAFYGAAGIADSVFVGFPLNEDAESHFGFHSGGGFRDADIALLAFALRGIRWFHGQLMLGHGLLMASAPLTATERKVMDGLLTEASEREIAARMGLATSTVHQHVVRIFRKFGVRSRAGLMSLWLRRGH